MKVSDICAFMERFAPKALAESWDNTGFLVGEKDQPCVRVMTCLTITPETVREAVEKKADCIISHHPMPFRALKELTSASTTGKLLRALIKTTSRSTARTHRSTLLPDSGSISSSPTH